MSKNEILNASKLMRTKSLGDFNGQKSAHLVLHSPTQIIHLIPLNKRKREKEKEKKMLTSFVMIYEENILSDKAKHFREFNCATLYPFGDIYFSFLIF